MEETYIIVGDNDYWYSHLVGTEAEAKKELSNIKKQIQKHQWRDVDEALDEPNELTLYKVKLVKETKLY